MVACGGEPIEVRDTSRTYRGKQIVAVFYVGESAGYIATVENGFWDKECPSFRDMEPIGFFGDGGFLHTAIAALRLFADSPDKGW